MANEEEKEKIELGKLYSEVLRENLGIQRVNTDELKIQIDLSKEIGGAFKITNEQGKAILKNSRDLSKQTANILRDEEAIIKGRRSKRDIDKEITKSTQTQNSALKEITQVTSQLASLRDRMKDDPKEVTEANMDQEKVLNDDGLRNEKEFVNHKILDLAGDFLLSGYRIVGKVVCFQGGHELSNMFLRKLLKSKSSYTTIELNLNLVSRKINSTQLDRLAVNG